MVTPTAKPRPKSITTKTPPTFCRPSSADMLLFPSAESHFPPPRRFHHLSFNSVITVFSCRYRIVWEIASRFCQ
ncbi:Hybrid PKS-NRPS synthetase mpsA [Trichinella pseudospiralis]